MKSDTEQDHSLLRALSEAVSAHNVDRILDFYAADAVSISPVFGEVQGRPAIAEAWKQMFLTMPDARMSVSDVLRDGPRMAIIATMNATDRVGWFGLPPTGAEINYRVIILLTFSGSKIVREERVYDLANLRERLDKSRLDAELNLAAEVQRALLPRRVQRSAYCEAAGSSAPSRHIGGDFFQLMDMQNGDMGIALGDVSGKGPSAAILAAMIQGMLTVGCRLGHHPSQTLSGVNRALLDLHLETRFVTMICGVLTPTGKFVYANAGHAKPFLVTKSGLIRLCDGDLIAGMFADATFPNHVIEMNPGESILMFTDGVTDAVNSAGENFGEERLSESLRHSYNLSPTDVLHRVLADVQEFSDNSEPADDLTLLAFKFCREGQ